MIESNQTNEWVEDKSIKEKQPGNNNRIIQSDMQNYIQLEKVITYRGYINNKKRDYDTRILCINANRIRYKDNKKIFWLADFVKKIILISLY